MQCSSFGSIFLIFDSLGVKPETSTIELEDSYVNDKDLTLPLFYLVFLLLGSLGIKPGASTITMEDSYANGKGSIFLSGLILWQSWDKS